MTGVFDEFTRTFHHPRPASNLRHSTCHAVNAEFTSSRRLLK